MLGIEWRYDLKLGLVSSYFNPCGFRKIRQNVQTFVDGLGADRKRLTIVELRLDDDEPLEIDDVRILTIIGKRPDNYLWQKECLLNYGIRKLSDEYDCAAWLDADITFGTPDWIKKAERALDQYAVVQLFNWASYLNRKGKFEYQRPGVMFKAQTGFTNKSCYGLAWAGRRSHVEDELIDWCVTGNADTFMVEGWMGIDSYTGNRASGPMLRLYKEWCKAQFLGESVGFINGQVTHLFHGSLENRRYGFRNRLLRDKQFDPLKDIERDKDGVLYRWTDRNPYLRDEVVKWFKSRKEDE